MMHQNATEFNSQACVRPEDMLNKLQRPHEEINQLQGVEYDHQLSFMLKQLLEKKYHYSESEEKNQQKNNIIENLRSVVRNWIKQIAINEEIPVDKIEDVGGDLKVFGSFSLEVNSQESDIDTVCIVPKFVNIEEHFFKELVEILSKNPEITDLFCIQEALVPLIRLKYSGVSFDLLFCKIDDNYINNKINLDNNSILQNMDEKSYRSFNGCRVAQYLQKTIKNYKNFQISLKLVKLWAKNRGIYSNIIGYLSGIGWTILMAKICQLYPKADVDILLQQFFFIYSQWTWQDLPVTIEEIRADPSNARLSQEQWKNEYQYKNLMMIITPCFPCMNTAHNVSLITQKIIQKEFKIASQYISQIKTMTKTRAQQNQVSIRENKSYLQNSYQLFKKLFKKTSFFLHFNHFLQINVMAKNQLDFNIWQGHVESKFRKLTRMFEGPNFQNLIVHPYPYALDSKDENFSHCCSYFYGLKFEENKMDESIVIDLKEPVIQFVDHIENTYPQKVPNTMNIHISHVLQSEIKDLIIENKKKFNNKNNDEDNENNSKEDDQILEDIIKDYEKQQLQEQQLQQEKQLQQEEHLKQISKSQQNSDEKQNNDNIDANINEYNHNKSQ